MRNHVKKPAKHTPEGKERLLKPFLACPIVQREIAIHFERSHTLRHQRAHSDPFFVEGLLEHILEFDEREKARIACPECWTRYHDHLKRAREK